MVNFIIFNHRCKTVNKLESMNKIVYSLKRSTTEVLDCPLYKVVGYLKVKLSMLKLFLNRKINNNTCVISYLYVAFFKEFLN
jgi:hypothetical protein